MVNYGGGRSVDLEALLDRVQGMPVHPTPANINQEPNITDVIQNLEQQMARIMAAQLHKFEERVKGTDTVHNLEQQIAQIMTAQLDKFEERVQRMPIYSTSVYTKQESGLADIVHNLQQMARTVTAQADKLEAIVGVVNSLKTDYKQMSTKSEKLQADVTVLQARLATVSAADKHMGVHSGKENASHDEMHDTPGIVAIKGSDDGHDEIHEQLGMGRYEGTTTQNASYLSRFSKIYPLCNESNEEPENVPSTHGELNNTPGGSVLDYRMNRRFRPVFAFEEAL